MIKNAGIEFQSTRLREARQKMANNIMGYQTFQSTRLREARQIMAALEKSKDSFNPRACVRRDLQR